MIAAETPAARAMTSVLKRTEAPKLQTGFLEDSRPGLIAGTAEADVTIVEKDLTSQSNNAGASQALCLDLINTASVLEELMFEAKLRSLSNFYSFGCSLRGLLI